MGSEMCIRDRDKKDLAMAKKALDHAIELQPEEARFQYLKGCYNLLRNDGNEALPAWRKAYRLNPEIFVTYATQVQILLTDEKYEHLIAASGADDREMLQKLQDVKSGQAVKQVLEQAKRQVHVQQEEKKSLVQKLKNLFK